MQGQQYQVDHDGVIALEALLHATMSLVGERVTALAGCANLAERLGDLVQRSLGLRQRVRPAGMERTLTVMSSARRAVRPAWRNACLKAFAAGEGPAFEKILFETCRTLHA